MKVGYIFALKLNLQNLLHLHHRSLFYQNIFEIAAVGGVVARNMQTFETF